MTVQLTPETISIEQIRNVQERLEAASDFDIAKRVDDLARRVTSNLDCVYIAFCGLFSAGKSSLLNTLCESDILATGAIPTTAETHEVSLPSTHGKVIFIDTPGVDSTDSAHQAETEAALHRADLVALVMDYQHVESEGNLELARQFAQQGKRLFLIVNQIDKHVEWELSFSEFKRRVESTLQEYAIPYERIFYTSSELSAPNNDLSELRKFVANLAVHAEEIATASIRKSLVDLVTQHVTRVQDETKLALEDELFDMFGYIPYTTDEAKDMLMRVNEERHELAQSLEQQTESIFHQFQEKEKEFIRSIELAQIAPYDTTERGRTYVLSLRSDFKVGWIGSAQKTAQERARRLEVFLTDLHERIEKYLLWPLLGSLRQFAQELVSHSAEFISEIDEVRVTVTPELCEQLVKQGALINDQYPYQYVKDVVSEVKRQASTRVRSLLERRLKLALVQFQEQHTSDRAEQEKLEAQAKQLERYIGLDDDRHNRIEEFMSTRSES